MKNHTLMALGLGVLVCAGAARADNPLVLDQFTSDPTARVFEGKIYLYPSHDIAASAGGSRGGWFAMADYHVFSSENLIDWEDHGVIVDQKDVAWVSPNNSMWAPDCVNKGGKYYFYFPAPAKPGAGGRGGQSTGVAVAEKPEGPYTPELKPISGVGGIDPCVFIDKDGQGYIYTAVNRRIMVAKLKENMLELDGVPQALGNTPTTGLVEGPFIFERQGNYYLTYPHENNGGERLEYAMGKSPMGPFTWTGVIMDKSPSGCWTNHHSIVEYKNRWYVFYHDKDLSPNNDKNRSVRADYLYFNEDGTILKVIPTLRGVGIKDAKETIQIDRYSAVSQEGTAVAFLDDAKKELGWKITLDEKAAWVQYNRVDFGNGGWKRVKVRAVSPAGGVIDIRLDNPESPVVAEVKIGKGGDWNVSTSKLLEVPAGVRNLVVSLKEKSEVAVDWVSFE